MFENIFNRNSSQGYGNPLEKNLARRMLDEGSVSNFLKNSFNSDQVNFNYPQSIGAIPANSTFYGIKSPAQQIMDVGTKYKIPYTGNIETYQPRVVKALIMHKAMEYGVPLNIALGVAGNESGWQMWSNIQKGTVLKSSNSGSADWGAMQLNDKANTKVFPRAKQDLEYNVDYGMKILAQHLKSIKGNLGLGFGDWDRAVAAYNLGHNPSSKNDFEIAKKYVSHVKSKSLQV